MQSNNNHYLFSVLAKPKMEYIIIDSFLFPGPDFSMLDTLQNDAY